MTERTDRGLWEGALSSSALSTATAVAALAEVEAKRYLSLITGGLKWLTAHRNADGGWGDTTLSKSNISTTVLCWAALGAAGAVPDIDAADAIAHAERWISRAAGGLSPEAIRTAIEKRYGRDKTFSVPILSMCAVTGRFGTGKTAWKHVRALPFELAVLPHSWFRLIKLPVVSYALPALIAIGIARFAHCPPCNPVSRLIRSTARSATISKLKAIQPSDGGFLEAAPLTSFVVMNLAAGGLAGCEVVQRGVSFLEQSVRDDGSWPIDTNLSLWLTSLSVQTLCRDGEDMSLNKIERSQTRSLLLETQLRTVHPYTQAEPGGWSWTDLPGGVPDADDTSGALLALKHVGGPMDNDLKQAVRSGLAWLADLQNSDGGIPTFCRGWGRLPFDRSGTDITAHALRAFSAWKSAFSPPFTGTLNRAIKKGIAYLERMQHDDGSWTALWFGNEHLESEENRTYGTARVLAALAELLRDGRADVTGMLEKGVAWQRETQNADGGWGGGGPGCPSSIEETALSVESLARCAPYTEQDTKTPAAGGIDFLIAETGAGVRIPASPIGFYFAKLWYYERLYPLIFTLSALKAAAGFWEDREQ